MLKIIFSVATLFLSVAQIFSQTQQAEVQIDFLETNYNTEKRLGLVGIHANIKDSPNFYYGIGLYGAVTGDKGGLFTLGANLGYELKLNNQFSVDIATHLGGGGGDAAPVGGGIFSITNLGLNYDFTYFKLGFSYSYLSFWDGNIEGDQVQAKLKIPFNYNYHKFEDREQEYSFTGRERTIASKHEISLKADNIFPFSESHFENNVLDHNLNLIGFGYSYLFENNFLATVELDGAYRGKTGGFMDVFIGAGKQYTISFFKLSPKLLIGAAGGGGIQTEGGLLFYPKLGSQIQLTKTISLGINSGAICNPFNDFYSYTLGASLNYSIYTGGNADYNNELLKNISLKGVEISFSNQSYINAQRYPSKKENISHLTSQLNVYPLKNIYLAGQATFAYMGNSGAYAEGLVGAGVRKQFKKHSIFTQLMAGTGAGGGVDTEQGFLLKPSIGSNLQFNDIYALQTKLGYVYAPTGNLSCFFFGIGFNYSISLAVED